MKMKMSGLPPCWASSRRPASRRGYICVFFQDTVAVAAAAGDDDDDETAPYVSV